jgi:DNA-binding response OmpR family regulator
MKSHGKKIILSIDDDDLILDVVKQVLELEGFHIITATNGQEGLDLLMSLPDDELPNLILLDQNMPVLNGDQFNRARLLVPRLRSIPVVMMTASGDIKKFMDEVEAEAYIDKPMGIHSIVDVARNFIHRRSAAQTAFLA